MRNFAANIFCLKLLVFAHLFFSACGPEIVIPEKKKGIVAIVYADLTGSIDKETAKRLKENVVELFQKLPTDSKFYLYSVDRGTSKPDIYKIEPAFTEIRIADDEPKVDKEKAEYEVKKKTIELERITAALEKYHNEIAPQSGPVSCITNKLNSLIDLVKSKQKDFPNYDLRVYFYSDMIEECAIAFDGKPLDFKRLPEDVDEEKHLKEIEERVANSFEVKIQQDNLKSRGADINIILTSQDDKQNLNTIKKIWNRFFIKLGFATEDISWTLANSESLWKLD